MLLYFIKVQTPATKSKIVKKKEESSSSEESSDDEEPAKPVSKPVGKVSVVLHKLYNVLLSFVQSKKPPAAAEDSSDSDEDSSSSEEQAVTATRAKTVQNANQDSPEESSSSEEEAPAKPKVKMNTCFCTVIKYACCCGRG